MPTRFPIAKGPVRLCGVIADVDAETGSCLAIKRFSLLLEDPPSRVQEGGC
jgi:calcineurin-like phosphoesterase